MSDVADAVSDAIEKAGDAPNAADEDKNASKLNTIIAASVAVSATFMALCNVKDGNVCQAMQQAQTKSVDAWSYFQAKGTKENLALQTVDQLTIQRDLDVSRENTEARSFLNAKIRDYTEKAAKYAAEKEEIRADALQYERTYDELNVHDDQFDMAEATISIGIALFGVTALTRKRWLLAIGFVFGGFGTLLGLAGFIGWSFHPDFLARLLS